MSSGFRSPPVIATPTQAPEPAPPLFCLAFENWQSRILPETSKSAANDGYTVMFIDKCRRQRSLRQITLGALSLRADGTRFVATAGRCGST
jgi:hypothetical protein